MTPAIWPTPTRPRPRPTMSPPGPRPPGWSRSIRTAPRGLSCGVRTWACPRRKRPKKEGDGDWEFDPFMVFSGGAPQALRPQQRHRAGGGRPAGGHRGQGRQGQERAANLPGDRRGQDPRRVGQARRAWRKPTWWIWPGSSPATANRRWPTYTGASPSTPPGFITSWST